MSMRDVLRAAAVAVGLVAVAGSGSVAAHDFWLQPRAFWTAPGQATVVGLLIGHGAERERWSANLDRVLLFRSVSAAGVVDHRAVFRNRRSQEDHVVALATPGAHVLLFASGHAQSELPGARFTEYLKEEGLTPALNLRTRNRTMQRPGRELYSRRAKALVQVGPPGRLPQAHVTRPSGLTLEIVPEANPYQAPAGAPLPVRVFFEGRPLPGALVKLRDINADAEPVRTVRTDAAGRALFRNPDGGQWQLNVVWTKPLAGHPWAEFDTTFSSLTFGFPAPRARSSVRPQAQ